MDIDPPAITPPCGFLTEPPEVVDTPMLLSLCAALLFVAAQLWSLAG
ncbi:hypothetical protein IBL26_22845 [Roseomonas aerophila]|uniref:Uncharacterized protein n=1 Tax=Teichococcus aerophilus TaxID=1224513 RepID=A0ABR7RTY0_9PROT|nr:hypothetical protein [Pseudoroseomonas aerophila]MBC9209694.1 hypothetical protein [Pseudoroseomonas aerophila]